MQLSELDPRVGEHRFQADREKWVMSLAPRRPALGAQQAEQAFLLPVLCTDFQAGRVTLVPGGCTPDPRDMEGEEVLLLASAQ